MSWLFDQFHESKHGKYFTEKGILYHKDLQGDFRATELEMTLQVYILVAENLDSIQLRPDQQTKFQRATSQIEKDFEEDLEKNKIKSDHTMAMMYYCLELMNSKHKEKAFDQIWKQRNRTAELRVLHKNTAFTR